MAVTNVTEKTDSRAADAEWNRREYTRVYIVQTDSVGSTAADNEATVLTASFGGTTIPAMGEAHPGNALATVGRTSARLINSNPQAYEVTIVYETRPRRYDTQNATSEEPNPVVRPSQISYGFAHSTFFPMKDLDDKELRNSAGAPFEGIEVPLALPQLTITTNVPYADYNFMDDSAYYVNKTNSDVFLSAPIGSLLMVDAGAERQFEAGVYYWQMHYVMQFREETAAGAKDGWKTHVLDAGYRCMNDKDTSTQYPVTPRDEFGNPYNEPFCLDGTGRQLEWTLIEPPPGPQWFHFRFYEDVPFGPILRT